MAFYSIPRRFLPGFNDIANFDTEKLQAVTGCMEGVIAGEGATVLGNKFLEIKELAGHDVDTLSNTIFSLVSLNQAHRGEGFIKDIRDAYSRTLEESNLHVAESFGKNLIEILKSSETVSLSVKAFKVREEYDKNFDSSRIISDIRTVFSEDFNKESKCAIMVHNLRLQYVQDEELFSTYIALDKEDLISLREDIDRALEKEDAIKDTKEFNFITLSDS